MASDVQKAVDIALKLTGIDAKQITPLVTAFKNLEKNIKSTQTSVKNIQKSLSNLKTPTAITTLSKSFTDLAKVKLKDLGPLATNLTKLSKISSFPNIGTFVNNIQKLSTTSFAGLQGLTKQFQALISLNIASVVTKLSDFNAALATLEKRGGLASFAKFASDIRQMKAALDASQTSVKKMTDGIGQISQAVTQGETKLRTLGDKISTVFEFRVISEGLLLLKNSISDGIAAIINYDQALKDLQAITSATNTEVAQMGVKILEVASGTKFSAEEVAAGMRTLGQAGFTASEAIQTMQSVSDLATGTLSDMSRTVDLITTAMRVFQIDASESAKVSDTFANAVNKSKLTIEKLRTSMNYVGPVAHNVGISFQEVSAAMMTLANSGLRASTIGTSLRQVLAQLAAPSKKFRDAAREAGVAMQDLDPTTNSLSSVLASLRLVVQDTGTAFDIFGKRGASAAIALTNQNSQYDALLGTVSKTGTAAEMAAKQMEGLGVSFKNLSDKVGNLAIALGEGGITSVMRLFVDVARIVVDALILLAETAFGKLVIQITVTITTIGVLIGTFVALKTALAGTAIAAFLSTIVSVTKATWAAVLATKAWNVSILANPFGKIAVGIISLITGLVLLFEKLTGKTKETSENLLIVSDEIGNLGKKILDAQVSLVSLEKGTNEYKNILKSLKSDLKDSATGVGELSDEALAAYESIDTLNGRFVDGGKAVEEYRKVLNKLKLEKLGENFKKAADDFKKATHNAFKEWLEIDDDSLFGQFDTGKISLKELQDQIDSFDMDTMTKEQKNQAKQFEFLKESAGKFFQELLKLNEVNMNMTIEEFKNFAKSLNLSQTQMKFLVNEFERVKEVSQSARNVLEKWAQDPGSLKLAQNVETLKDVYGTLGNVISQQQKDELKGVEDIRRKRVAAFQELEKQRPKPGATEAEWLAFYAKEQELFNKSSQDRATVSQNTFAQLLVDIDQTHAAHKQKLTEIDEEFKDNNQERARQIVQADQELANKKAKIYKDYIDKIVTQSEGLSEGFGSEVDQMSSEFSKLEKESQKVWKNIGTHSDSTLKEQQQAIGNWVGTVQEKMNSFSETTQGTLNKLGENLALALEKGDSEQIQKIGDAIKEVTDKGSEYYEQMGNSITTVLDHIASKEAELLNNIETYAQKALAVQKEVENALFNLEQKRMTESEKYQSNRLKAEEKFKQAAIQSAQAQKLSGDEAVKAYEKAETLAEEGYQLSLKLQSAVKITSEVEKKITASKEKERDLRQELSELSSGDEEGAKKIQKVQANIAEEVNKQKGYQEELTKSNEAYKTVQESILRYQELIKVAEEGKIKTKKEELGLLEEQKTKIEELKINIDEMKTSIEAIEFNIDTENAKAALLEFSSKIEELTKEPSELNFSIDPSNSVKEEITKTKEEIVKVGDTWTNVWTTAEKEAKEAVQSINESFDDKEINVNFTGTGSSTQPITEKIEDIKSKFAALVTTLSEDIEVSIILKGIDKAISKVKELVGELEEIKDKSVTIRTKYVTEGSPPSQKRWGGRIPGYGGGDRHPILAESGEWFIRKEAVQKYGDSFFASLNNMSLPKFQDGGRVGASLISSKQTNSSSVLDSLSNFGTVNLVTEGGKVPAIVHSNVISELNSHLSKMKRFGT